jgi:SAM-dependent methyltransferase
MVLGVDFSAAMLKRARQAVSLAHADNIGFCQAAGENLPVKAGVVDVAMINGIFNLNPAREAIFRELVLRPTRNALFITEDATSICGSETPVDAAAAAIGTGVPDAGTAAQFGESGNPITT